LLLLEGLEKFDDSWQEIADYVGTRTREECVVKFLQLEIEDKYLDSEPATNSSTGMGLLGAANGHVPFNQADNPVMSVIGFLANLADPHVAAAAAGKSVDAMKASLKHKLEKDYEGADKSSDKGKESDAMEIDIHHQEIMTTTTTTTTTKTSNTLATASLAATAARAAALATHEEREMTRLVSAVVNTTLQKFELKLQQFNEMEAIVQAERRELERGRQQLFLDRLSFKKRVKDVQEGLRVAAQTGGEEGIRLAQDVMGEGEKLAFTVAGKGEGSVQPLSAEGAAKSFDI
jgi:SWI/SNF related-matrix-associated actin-dependent regulator of chromatin subfamily C